MIFEGKTPGSDTIVFFCRRPPATGHRSPATGQRPAATGHRPAATSHRPPATPSITAHRPLATGQRPPATGHPIDHRPPAIGHRPAASGHPIDHRPPAIGRTATTATTLDVAVAYIAIRSRYQPWLVKLLVDTIPFLGGQNPSWSAGANRNQTCAAVGLAPPILQASGRRGQEWVMIIL